MIRLLALATILVGACSKKEGGDRPVDNPARQYTEAKSIALMGKLANVYEDSGSDCDKLVADLKTFTTENKAEMHAQSEWKATLTPEQKAALDTKYATELHVGTKMVTAAQACGDSPGLQQALKELDRVLE